MDTAHYPTTTEPRVIRGEFAPLFWEPLSKRGERLVVGMVLTNSQGVGKAYQTLHHKRLLEFISQEKSESATGLLEFTFEYLNKTMHAGGAIEDLRVPFASMSLGRTELITARSEQELLNRATKLCTLLGQMPEEVENKISPIRAAETTQQFIKGIRHHIQMVDKKLAKSAMKLKQFYHFGNTKIRIHFQFDRQYAQFCSLPLPNAHPDMATECQARLLELLMINKLNCHAKVALCINNQAIDAATDFQGKTNATLEVRNKTLEMAKSMQIPVHEYHNPAQAAKFLLELAHV